MENHWILLCQISYNTNCCRSITFAVAHMKMVTAPLNKCCRSMAFAVKQLKNGCRSIASGVKQLNGCWSMAFDVKQSKNGCQSMAFVVKQLKNGCRSMAFVVKQLWLPLYGFRCKTEKLLPVHGFRRFTVDFQSILLFKLFAGALNSHFRCGIPINSAVWAFHWRFKFVFSLWFFINSIV